MKVGWSHGKYNNGATKQTYKLCYIPQFSSNRDCIDVSNVNIGSTMHFSGRSTSGRFVMEVVLTGGSYPAVVNNLYDILVQFNLD